MIELSEDDAAAFLHRKGASRSVEVIGWVEDDGEDETQPGRIHNDELSSGVI